MKNVNFDNGTITLPEEYVQATGLVEEFTWQEAAGCAFALVERMQGEIQAMKELRESEVALRDYTIPVKQHECELMREVWHGIIKHGEGRFAEQLATEVQAYLAQYPGED